jgi:hypothetical protein
MAACPSSFSGRNSRPCRGSARGESQLTGRVRPYAIVSEPGYRPPDKRPVDLPARLTSSPEPSTVYFDYREKRPRFFVTVAGRRASSTAARSASKSAISCCKPRPIGIRLSQSK